MSEPDPHIGPRRKLMTRIEIGGTSRFLTFSCTSRLPLLGDAEVRDVFVRHLAAAKLKFRFILWAFVVMPEHVHMLMRPADASVVSLLWTLKRGVAKEAIALWRERRSTWLDRTSDDHGSPQFWQRGGGYDRVIVSEQEFDEKLNYIHANPVKRGLVKFPEEWRWSSAAWYRGERGGPLVIGYPP